MDVDDHPQGEISASENLPQQAHPLSDPEERRVLYAALDSFRSLIGRTSKLNTGQQYRTRQYRHAAHYNVTHLRRQSFYTLPSAHMDILCEPPFSLPSTFDAVDDAIDSNADLSEAILNIGLSSFGLEPEDDSRKGTATPNDMDKARSTIRQFYRDWSAEGSAEREASYSPIISALHDHLPDTPVSQRHKCSVLIPGAGLGRLLFEICAAGYTVEGNEISYHQLLASNYILNCTHSAGQHQLYPWALSFSNHLSRAAQLQAVAVPDIHPPSTLRAASEKSLNGRMSMTAGDFCDLYRQPCYQAAFDVVATCFFIDTAPNVLNYIETIKHCVKPGGLWINLGPLLWHFEATPTPAEQERSRQRTQPSESPNGADSDAVRNPPVKSHRGIGEPGSFELSQDEVVALVQRSGFSIVESKHAPSGATGYIQNTDSMLQTVYRPSFWVAKKDKVE